MQIIDSETEGYTEQNYTFIGTRVFPERKLLHLYSFSVSNLARVTCGDIYIETETRPIGYFQM